MMPGPAELGRIIDRACADVERMTGRPPDRRLVAESVFRWCRALWPLLKRLR